MLFIHAGLLFKLPIPVGEVTDDIEVHLLPLPQIFNEVAMLTLLITLLPKVLLTKISHVALEGMHIVEMENWNILTLTMYRPTKFA